MRIGIVAVACWFVALLASAAGAADGPNVILVLVDDQGYGDLSCHGNPVLKTPNLDALHDQSVRLTDFHAAPMCTPTRSQLMTGLDALRNGAMNVSSGRTNLRTGIPTMADAFAAAGYGAGLFGKWHLGDNYPYRPQDRGFHKAIWFPSSHIPSAPDRYQNDYFDPWFRLETGKTQRFSGYCTDIQFTEAMKWMEQCAARGERFFTYLALNSAHGPLLVPDKYREPYRHLAPAVASFYAMIANIDENIGRLEAFLWAKALRDNTLVIFMTDNGGTAGVTMFNAGMRGRKVDLEEGGHRVPCFLRWPGGGFGEPRNIDTLSHCQDLLPTVAELCSLKLSATPMLDGLSLAPLLRGALGALPDRMLVVQFSRMNKPEPQRGDAAVLWKKWRLVRDAELYDLATDPRQENNVIAKHPEVAAAMRRHYAQWWAQVSSTVNDISPIVIGSDAENPTMLSPADWANVFLDQSAQVRAGLGRNGTWHVHADREGVYEFELRRWPAESDLPLRASAPALRGGDSTFPAGKALPIRQARIEVGQQDLTRHIKETDRAAVFKMPLKAGPTTIRTAFFDDKGNELCGAYYLYVSRKVAAAGLPSGIQPPQLQQ